MDVEHGAFVDDEEVCFEGVLVVFFESSCRGLPLKETVDGFGFEAYDFCHALGGSACRGGEEDGFAHGLDEGDEDSGGCGFSAARASCEDGEAGAYDAYYGFFLF